MYVPFRQGIVKHQLDTNSHPAFLQKINGGQYISLVISPTPAVINFSYSTTDYLFEETRTVTNAWGPFSGSVSCWLYWDIDMLSAVRTFGSTLYAPIYSGTAPYNPQNDQHWFNTTTTTMMVWNGTRWDERIRCFAAEYQNGAILLPVTAGTQAGLSSPVNSGFILFDDDEKPVKKWRRDNKGMFLTSETPFLSHASRVSNVVLDGMTRIYFAAQSIPQWSVVCCTGYDQISLASYSDQHHPAIGIAKWNMNVGDEGIIHTSGYLSSSGWNWTAPASTPLFVGPTGQITTIIPQVGSIQRIGMIIDPNTISIDIGPQIVLIQS